MHTCAVSDAAHGFDPSVISRPHERLMTYYFVVAAYNTSNLVSQGTVTGFGIAGYDMALRGLRDMLKK